MRQFFCNKLQYVLISRAHAFLVMVSRFCREIVAVATCSDASEIFPLSTAQLR